MHEISRMHSTSTLVYYARITNKYGTRTRDLYLASILSIELESRTYKESFVARHQVCVRYLRISVGLLLAAGVAGAAPVINIFPSIGPDSDAAATFSQYSANALFALEHGLSSYGSAGASYYEQASAFSSSDIISSYDPDNPGLAYNSWRGQTPPPAGYEGQYGNMLYWGAAIYGNGQRFSLNDVMYTESFFGKTSFSSLGSLGFADAVGIYFGADGVLGGGDDVRYTGALGNGSTKLDVLYFSGMGSAFLVNDPSKLAYYLENIRIADYPSVRGGYMVGTPTGFYSGSQSMQMSDAVPEPATFGFVGIGLLAIGYAARKWKR